MVLGHELYNLWGQFASDVRIEVYSDSCHSRTVIRELFTNWPVPQKKAVPIFIEISDAETSAYLLMAGGLAWVLVGIVGLVRPSRRRRENDL